MFASSIGVWVALCCFGASVVSALVPWVNAEAILLAFATTARSERDLAALVVVATAGQMLGKWVLYCLARGASHRCSPGRADTIARWRQRLEGSPRASLILVFVSSFVGVPPFYVVTVLAGAGRVGLAGFLGAGTAGRLMRFAAIVALPRLAIGTLA